MEKKVYCLIGERCKCIKFSSQSHISDAQIVRCRLVEAATTDIVLQTMINNKMLILQKCGPDRNNKFCDIEDDDEIEDKSEIRVLFFEISSNVNIECDNSVMYNMSKNVQIDDNLCTNIKIIHTEPINSESSASPLKIQKLSTNARTDMEKENVSIHCDILCIYKYCFNLEITYFC